jgi:WD40 repeat protein
MLEDGAVIDDSNANLPSDSEEEEELIVAKIESINPIPTIRVDPKHTGIMSIDSNSKSPLIAAGLVDGWIQMFKYGEENEQVAQFNHHASGCRSVKFSSDGKLCFTASSDQSISVIDVQAQKIAFTVEKAHE